MRIQPFFIASLAALRTTTALPNRQLSNPDICKRPKGIYDVCDTEHSFIRCSGHDALLITDCKVDDSTYCQIINGRGRCDGKTPPHFPPDETNLPTYPSASAGPM